MNTTTISFDSGETVETQDNPLGLTCDGDGSLYYGEVSISGIEARLDSAPFTLAVVINPQSGVGTLTVGTVRCNLGCTSGGFIVSTASSTLRIDFTAPSSGESNEYVFGDAKPAVRMTVKITRP